MTETSNRPGGAVPVESPSTELRTFMIADVRGYTRFTQERGDEAGAQLAMLFASLARDSAAARGGEVIELRGDEAFAVFPSARQALRASIELLERCAAQGEADPLFPLPVGIGLDAGEAVRVEGGFRGGAINLAARLCSLAGRGEVLASEGVIHLARRTEGLRYAERGLVELKGFVDPVRVIHVTSGTQSPGEPLIAPLPPGALQTEARLPIGGFLGSLPASELVARDEELLRILPSVDAVEEGSGQFVLLAGERGVGKTRLAQEITLKVRDRGFLVATGRCYEHEQSVAFLPFLEALPMAYAASPLALRIQISRNWPHLGRLLPDQMAPVGSPDEPLSPEDQQRLFRSVTGFLAALAEERPVTLMLDDLHWADEWSLRLLQHLARTTRGSRLLLVGTYRDTEVSRDAPLDRTIRDTLRERLVDRIIIRRLSAEGTAALIASMIGDMEASEEFAEYVHRRTKGNPYSIEEILRALAGRYRLVREIGAGGMGRVFQAVDMRTGTSVAAKIMFASRDVDLDALLRFQQEGAVLSTLNHPNIVQVYSTFLEEHASVIIMELLTGQPLDRALDTGRLDLPRIKHLVRQVTNALAFAHGKSIVHRDIKPDNIMVLDGDRVKVTDFGIARIVREGASTSTMMGTGMTLGTPLYSAPEQIEGRKVDGRADIYALGAVLYQIVTGRPPFDGDDPLTVAYKHVNQAPDPPTEMNATIPPDWETLILKALAKDPAHRFQSAAVMEKVISDLSIEPRTAGARVSRPVKSNDTPPVHHPDLTVVPAIPEPPITPQVPDGAAIERLVHDRLEHTLLPQIQEQIGVKIRAKTLGKHVAGRIAHPQYRHPIESRRGLTTHLTLPRIVLALVIVLVTGGLGTYAFRPKSVPSFAIGQPVAGWGTKGLSAQPFSYPSGAAADAQHNVYVADGLHNRIVKLGGTGALLDEWGSRGSDHGQFDGPSGVAVDGGGNVYVADTNNGRVEEYSPTGVWLKSWGTRGSGIGHLSSPAAVVVDEAGSIYVADTGNNRIQKWSKTGAVQIWGATASRPLDAPAGVAVDVRGNLYVANSSTVTSNVVELSPTGKLVRIIGKLGIQPGRFNGPKGLTVDPQGNLYVADFQNHRIQEFTSSGRYLRTWGQDNSPDPFAAPVAVASDTTGVVYAVDAGANRIEKLSPGVRHFTPWGRPAQSPGGLSRPSSVAVDGQENVYVTDTGNNRVAMFTPDRNAPHMWGTSGSGPGQFSSPGGLAVDRQGDVFVAEELNHRIQVFSRYGVVLKRWGHSGSSLFDTPHGMAVDAQGAVYVSDAGSSQVKKLSHDGTLVSTWDTAGGIVFSFPQGLAVDRHGHVYLADELNNRIVELSSTGAVLATWNSAGGDSRHFRTPSGVAVDQDGNVYVADSGNNRIVKFAPGSSAYNTLGHAGRAPGEFNNPAGVAIDAHSNVYVADSGNNRVQKFSPVP